MIMGENSMENPAKNSRKSREQYRSRDVFCSGYLRMIQRVREYTWYDVCPYSLSLWPHYFSEKIRRGDLWIRRYNYTAIAIELQLEGTTIYENGSFRDELRPGELYVTVPGGTVRLGGDGNSGRQILVVVAGAMVRLLTELVHLTSSRRIPINSKDDLVRIRALLARIAELVRDRKPETALESSTLGYQLICLVGELGFDADVKGLPPPLTYAVRMMSNGYGSRFSISQLAEKFGISRATLNNLFRQYLGTTPRAYQHKICMENAIQLVRSGELSFKEISEQLGFRNSLYFSTVFRRYTGMTPTEYRRNWPTSG